MNDFFEALSVARRKFNWVIENNTIVATDSRGTRYNPVTALARSLGHKVNGNSKRETLRAGTALGLSRDSTEHIYNATKSTYNRGNVQVIRGRLRSALGL